MFFSKNSPLSGTRVKHTPDFQPLISCWAVTRSCLDPESEPEALKTVPAQREVGGRSQDLGSGPQGSAAQESIRNSGLQVLAWRHMAGKRGMKATRRMKADGVPGRRKVS